MTNYGPGDEQTWGPCVDHPNDPRTDDDQSEDDAEERRRDREDHLAEQWIELMDEG